MNPSETTFLYAGQEWCWEDVVALRHLHLGPVTLRRKDRWSPLHQGLYNLVQYKYAMTIDEAGLSYHATPALLDLQRRHNERIKPMPYVEPAIAAKEQRKYGKAKGATPRKFPSVRDTTHQAVAQQQAQGFTVSPVEEPGDEFQFSSRGLTDWYVRQFCQLNYLKA